MERTIRRTNQAPVVVILCRDTTCVNPQPDSQLQEEEVLMGTQSVALAGLQLLLAAHAEGLGGTWICWPSLPQKKLARPWDCPPFGSRRDCFSWGTLSNSPMHRPGYKKEEITRWI